MEVMQKESQAMRGPDFARLAQLSKLAIGGRTLREFSEISELSEGFLSRLTTGKLKSAPTRRSLAKLMADTSKPQNGISLAEVMRAAGYPYTESERKTARHDLPVGTEEVPAVTMTAAFPTYLVASALESSGQLGRNYSSKNQREMFVIEPKNGPSIVGIPAFCALDAVEDEIREAKWNLMMALSIFGTDSKDKFFIILTNQKALYDTFDANRLVTADGEFYLALTEDFKSITAQRPVAMQTLNGEPVVSTSGKATYDLTVKEAAPTY